MGTNSPDLTQRSPYGPVYASPATADLTDPYRVMGRLAEIAQELAIRQNSLESAASHWFGAQREMERRRATALLTSARSSVAEKKAEGDLAALEVEGSEHGAEYEVTRAVCKSLESQSMILMSVLKAQGRA